MCELTCDKTEQLRREIMEALDDIKESITSTRRWLNRVADDLHRLEYDKADSRHNHRGEYAEERHYH